MLQPQYAPTSPKKQEIQDDLSLLESGLLHILATAYAECPRPGGPPLVTEACLQSLALYLRDGLAWAAQMVAWQRAEIARETANPLPIAAEDRSILLYLQNGEG